MLYLVLTVFLLHLSVVPLVISIKIDIDSDVPVGKITVKLFFIPVFVKKLHFEGFQDAVNGTPIQNEEKDEQEEHKQKKPSKFKKAIKDFLVKVAVRIAKRIRVREADLQSTIGTGDAAATAVSVSSALILYCQACAFLGLAPQDGAIRPDYERAKLFVKFYGIISLCFADIIYAVLSQILSKFAAGGKGEVHGQHIVTE
ncbi:MAG: hypothetical protein J1G38_05980 [Clostridiales bacterium]|nr:hypothetical protein [Clostridiales bacterium]